MVLLCVGIGIVFIPPIVLEAISSYSSDNETLMRQIEDATNSTLVVSTLPALSTALLIVGLVGLVVHGLLKNKLSRMV